MQIDPILLWMKLVLISLIWTFGYTAYSAYYDLQEFRHLIIALLPLIFTIVIPTIITALYFLFFVWE